MALESRSRTLIQPIHSPVPYHWRVESTTLDKKKSKNLNLKINCATTSRVHTYGYVHRHNGCRLLIVLFFLFSISIMNCYHFYRRNNKEAKHETGATKKFTKNKTAIAQKNRHSAARRATDNQNAVHLVEICKQNWNTLPKSRHWCVCVRESSVCWLGA